MPNPGARLKPSDCDDPHSLSAEQYGGGRESADGGILGGKGMDPPTAPTKRASAEELLAQWRTRERALLQARSRVWRAKVALAAAEREKQARSQALADTETAVLATGDAAAIALLVDTWRAGADTETEPGSPVPTRGRGGQAKRSQRSTEDRPGGKQRRAKADRLDTMEQPQCR